jgi:shikimate kinase
VTIGPGDLVVLVGPPGAGKSTVGALLAARFGVPFRDTDADVESAQGRSISELFVDEGEAYFRGLERAAVATALREHSGVLAVGGGAVLDDGTRAELRDRLVVFLDVGLTEATRRVGLSAARPLLLGNVRGRLTALLDSRRPLYAEVATLSVATDGKTPAQVVDEVLDGIGG